MKRESTEDTEVSEAKQDLDAEALKELDSFVLEKRADAVEYLKLLKEEIAKTDQSRTRHTYTTWLLLAMFVLLDTNSAQLHFEMFDKIDQMVLLKMLPAAIVATYYAMMSRIFIQRERLAIFDEIARRLFPGDHFPYSAYIRPTHFMLSERLLNRCRPSDELLGNNLMLGAIVTVTMYGPGVVCMYAYYLMLSRYGIQDGLVQAAAIVGLVFTVQALVVLRGVHVMSRQDRKATGKLSHGTTKHRNEAH